MADSVTRALASACGDVLGDVVLAGRVGSAAALRKLAQWLDPVPQPVTIIDAVRLADVSISEDGLSFGFVVTDAHADPGPSC